MFAVCVFCTKLVSIREYLAYFIAQNVSLMKGKTAVLFQDVKICFCFAGKVSYNISKDAVFSI